MDTLISRIAKQAFHTFRHGGLPKIEHLRVLQSLMNSVTIKDVNLEDQMLKPIGQYGSSYLDIYNDDVFSMGVFFLRKHDVYIPLHDHPRMYGLIKVLLGNACVETYDNTPTGLNICIIS